MKIKPQLTGVIIFMIGTIGYYFSDDKALQTIAGIICAMGLACVLKIMPFTKRNITK